MRERSIERRGVIWRFRGLTSRASLFRLHGWVGVGVGLYLLLVSTSGAALVFRGEMQRALYPELFPPPQASSSEVSITRVVENMAAAYPSHRLVGVSVPTDTQHAFVGYIHDAEAETYRAVFADARTGRVIGSFPERSFLLWLQNLHFYLLAGSTGLVVNGIGALLLAILCLTGLVIWWPGLARWRRALTVDPRRYWRRVVWDLHGAVGAWSVTLLLMWALTGAYFAFPGLVRSVVAGLLSVTSSPPIESAPSLTGPAVTLEALVSAAQRHLPASRVARVSLPETDRGPIQVVMTSAPPTSRETERYVYLYFDRFSGALLHRRDLAARTAGDTVLSWFGRLHVGAFGGAGVKLLWVSVGLAPAALFLTGIVMWWNRVVAPRAATARVAGRSPSLGFRAPPDAT